jgi:hypothetical protein
VFEPGVGLSLGAVDVQEAPDLPLSVFARVLDEQSDDALKRVGVVLELGKAPLASGVAWPLAKARLAPDRVARAGPPWLDVAVLGEDEGEVGEGPVALDPGTSPVAIGFRCSLLQGLPVLRVRLQRLDHPQRVQLGAVGGEVGGALERLR